MPDFKNGVKYYTSGVATIRINFPEDSVACCWCPFCRSESDLGRYWCRLNNTMIYNPYSGVSDSCPVEIERKE